MNEHFAAIADGALFTECFGDRTDPPILLIMGAMASAVWWPRRFCEELANRKRFVIRYDHRDTGRSKSYGPGAGAYTTEMLGEDALSILDGYNIESAHFAGMSLGGYLSQLIALKAPHRVKTITLIASESLMTKDRSIPGLDPRVLAYHAQAATLDWSDRAAVLEYQVGAWRLLCGSGHVFDEEFIRELAEEDWDRTANPLTAFNHAALKEPAGWLDRLDEIRVPALIIHGTDDLVVPYPHALASMKGLNNSRLLTLWGSGHELHPSDWPVILDAMTQHTTGF